MEYVNISLTDKPILMVTGKPRNCENTGDAGDTCRDLVYFGPENGGRSDVMMSMAEAVAYGVDQHPECVLPYTITCLLAAFIKASEQADGLDSCECLDEVLAKDKVDPAVMAKFIMYALAIPDVTGMHDLPNLDYWRDVATHMGPDYAQGMYHAAVFMTKVA